MKESKKEGKLFREEERRGEERRGGEGRGERAPVPHYVLPGDEASQVVGQTLLHES